MDFLKYLSIFSGIVSALCWLRASTVTVNRTKLEKIRQKIAKKQKTEPDYSGVSLVRNGKEYDLIETLHKQSFWNSCGAIMAAMAIFLNIL
ncbi:hypothetical protein [Pectobacterium aroidearum]|uniref:hypothetical protein n=1 Tax=Pectobacterium aroidearum TaxID=1201031 RepID=UPI0032EF4E86